MNSEDINEMSEDDYRLHLSAMINKLSDPDMDKRPLSAALEAEDPDNTDLAKCLRQTKVQNVLLMEDIKEAQKVDEKIFKKVIFKNPLGEVTIGKINPSSKIKQDQSQETFVVGTKVEVLMPTNVTLVEKRNDKGVTLSVHARTLRINDKNLTDPLGLAVKDVIQMPEKLQKHFGHYAISNVDHENGYILLEITNGETRKINTAVLPEDIASPLVKAVFERLSLYEQILFVEAVESDSIFDGRIGEGVIRKSGIRENIEITHIDPETLVQLKEVQGKHYSIILPQNIDSSLKMQLEGAKVCQISEMDDWMLSIYGNKTILAANNTGGNSTLTLD
jgi:hypothetical protein